MGAVLSGCVAILAYSMLSSTQLIAGAPPNPFALPDLFAHIPLQRPLGDGLNRAGNKMPRPEKKANLERQTPARPPQETVFRLRRDTKHLLQEGQLLGEWRELAPDDGFRPKTRNLGR